MVKLRNPLIQRGGPPVALNVRAARWGALACLLGFAIMVGPIVRGYNDAQRMMAENAELCGEPFAGPVGPADASDLRQAAGRWFVEQCEVPE